MGPWLQDLLSYGGKQKQIIGQAEIVPMLVARLIWSGKLKDRDVINYVDNDAARYSTIKGSSPSRRSAWLIHAFWETEAINRSSTWISRVPTVCNVGDGPSRLEWEELKRLYPRYVKREWSGEQDRALLSRWGGLCDS